MFVIRTAKTTARMRSSPLIDRALRDLGRVESGYNPSWRSPAITPPSITNSPPVANALSSEIR